MTVHRGHCRCEGVVVAIEGPPVLSVYCHCADCRRSAGAPLIAAVGFENDDLTWRAKTSLATCENCSCTRLFCNHCGSPVAQTHKSSPTRVFFYTAFMDEPEKFPPAAHSFAPEQLNWLELTDDLPRHTKTVSIRTD